MKGDSTRRRSPCLITRESRFARSTLRVEALTIATISNQRSSYRIIGASTPVLRLTPESVGKLKASRERPALLHELDSSGTRLRMGAPLSVEELGSSMTACP